MKNLGHIRLYQLHGPIECSFRVRSAIVPVSAINCSSTRYGDITHLFTCWPPAPDDLAKLTRARLIGIVFLFSSDAHFRASAYSASRSSSTAPVLWESTRACLVDVLRARRDSVPIDSTTWRNMRNGRKQIWRADSNKQLDAGSSEAGLYDKKTSL